MDQDLTNIREILGSCGHIGDDEAYELIEKYFIDSTDKDLDEIEKLSNKYFTKTRKKLGIMEDIIKDPTISEIMVNGKDDIFVERNGVVEKLDLNFDTTEELEEIIRYIASGVNREINEMNPIVDARLNDGSRINGVYKNIALNGPILTIRKFKQNIITMDKLVEFGSISREAADFLKEMVQASYNIFISGGTSSGKTTFLNALAGYIPETDRVIVIEDSAELELNAIENIVHMECRNSNSMGKGKIDMADLIKTSLRMRPDRIIIGEVRGKEVSDLLSALNTGHDGSLSTGHGNSVRGMLRRLESMYLMGSDLSVDAIAGQIIEGIDLMVHLGRLSNGRRIVMEISEIVDYIDGKYIINNLFQLNECGELVKSGNKLVKEDKLKLHGLQ
ncbi:MAG: CpaF family protein [Clostridia bacterium]|nr:CpaF family protein [Clostridia bacterium]